MIIAATLPLHTTPQAKYLHIKGLGEIRSTELRIEADVFIIDDLGVLRADFNLDPCTVGDANGDSGSCSITLYTLLVYININIKRTFINKIKPFRRLNTHQYKQ